jgi:hypothetical protein
MPEIKLKPITKVERIIMPHPLLTDDHDFKAEYQCSCGKPVAYYGFGRPDVLKKCMNCMFNENTVVGVEYK